MEEPENIQQPQNYSNHHYAIQNRLDGRLHRDKAVYQPQKNTHNHQNLQELN